ncbi:DUF814 domain-containing protein [archaeon]|jgi:predicted ribosome quality control (RQC) complex YloA/Tae2 family protein|nr:DUF814 domain-containing protein [archaeon]
MPPKYKTLTLSSGNKIFLGKDEKSNDILMKEFNNKSNTILHTVKPGSPFCVIENEPSKQDLKQAAIICAAKSQDWRDNGKSVKLHIFTGKQSHKPKGSKKGSWTLKTKPKLIKARKKEINTWLSEISN